MPKIMFIAEAYGAREELFNHALVGSSGAELGRMLHQAGLAPDLLHKYPSELEMIKYWKILREEHDIGIGNVFSCRPLDNKIELFFTNAKEGVKDLPPLKAGKYLRPELMFHVESLWHELREAKPNLIIALGNVACWAILGETKISELRGTVKTSPRLGFKVLPTYHPAAVLRQWPLRPIVISDLEKAKTEALSPIVTRIERYVTVEPTLNEISEWVTRPASFYAVDIETTGRSQISMIGFARTPADAIVIPFVDERKAGWNYWPTVCEEMEAWKLADRALSSSVPKIFQNGVFDLSYLFRAGFRPRACMGDTMLLHHSLYPEMLKGLGFLGSIYSAELAWKQMRTKGNNLKRDE
jgi:uracil-DNA glycosylase